MQYSTEYKFTITNIETDEGENVKVKFALEQATKAQMTSTGTALLFL
jgi:hypothetical protein